MIKHALKQVSEHPNMGVIVDSKMLFTAHINYVISKATRTLNFIRQNLYKCKQEVKFYYSLVQPVLEYASSAWDPYLA